MKYEKGRNAGDSNGTGDVPVKGGGDVPSIQLDIMQYRGGGGGGGGGVGSASGNKNPTPASGSGNSSTFSIPSSQNEPPEKQLTLFALRLAVLEKAATGLGKLDFVWATVVLLGGFAGTLNNTDFWCVTVILVSEGARIFGRSHELEWQHHATQTSTAGRALRSSSRFLRRFVHALVGHHETAADELVVSRSDEMELQDHAARTATTVGGALRSSSRFLRRVARAVANPASAAVADVGREARPPTPAQLQHRLAGVIEQRTWHAPDVSLVPYTRSIFVPRRIGRLLNWLQVLSGLTCVVLSLMRLSKHDFHSRDGAQPPGNMRPALLLFYTLAFVEASLFLLEKAYWRWKFSIRRLLHQVSNDCQLGAYGHASLTRFFYDAYSRCLAGSIFDGIKMDLVTFAEELILSDFHDEQLIGVRILQQFTTSEASASDTLRKVGTSAASIERLVEMLNWKRPDEEEVRLCAAEVVSRLAGKRQNALRVSSIPGAMESVMSLLYTGKSAPVSGTHPQPPHGAAGQHETASPAGGGGYDYLPFNLLGLLILQELARDHDNCGKIGTARGLLAKTIDFTKASPVLLRNSRASESQLLAVERALQVVKMLVSTTGNTGKALRLAVAEDVFTASNLRDILRYGQQQRELQKLAIDVILALAMDGDGKETILGTGGLVKLLLSVFAGAKDRELGCDAGDALAMLALDSERSCAEILKRDDVLDQIVSALQDGDARRLNAARLLRNLCAYSGKKNRGSLRMAAIKALPAALRGTMAESDRVLEVSVGLTTEICGFIDGERFAAELRGAGVADEREYVGRLAAILRQYSYPSIMVPRMRRFVVQQVIWLVTCSGGGGGYIELMREVGMEQLLESIADTTSELESYHVFSGSVGIGKHRKKFSAIVDSALELITAGARAQQ